MRRTHGTLWDSWSWGTRRIFVNLAPSLWLKKEKKNPNVSKGNGVGVRGLGEAGRGRYRLGWAGEQNRKQLWGELEVFKASSPAKQAGHTPEN